MAWILESENRIYLIVSLTAERFRNYWAVTHSAARISRHCDSGAGDPVPRLRVLQKEKSNSGVGSFLSGPGRVVHRVPVSNC